MGARVSMGGLTSPLRSVTKSNRGFWNGTFKSRSRSEKSKKHRNENWRRNKVTDEHRSEVDIFPTTQFMSSALLARLLKWPNRFAIPVRFLWSISALFAMLIFQSRASATHCDSISCRNNRNCCNFFFNYWWKEPSTQFNHVLVALRLSRMCYS